MTFTATASGGTPFPGQNSTYTYQWYVQKGTSCPGINTAYRYQIPVLRYSPTGMTSNCILDVQATDYLGTTVYSSTAKIVVNPLLYSTGILSRSAYNANQVQTVTVSMPEPTGGTPPYRYQWSIGSSIEGTLSSAAANSLCSVNPNSLNCVFITNGSTNPGVYNFELSYSDSSTMPPSLLSKHILVMIKTSANLTASTTYPTTTAMATTTATTVQTTSVYTTTAPPATTSIAQSTAPAFLPMGGPINIISEGQTLAVNLLKRILRFIV